MTKQMIDCVYREVSRIPKGRVSTYGDIAKKCQMKSARIIGRIIHANPDPSHIPCHRVVRKDRHIARGYAFGGREGQIEKLRGEGIRMENDRIQNANVFWV